MLNTANDAVKQSKTPEMEMLGANLHETASQLVQVADALEGKIARFLGHPFGSGAPAQTNPVQVAAPQPGTLASLKDASADIANTTSRLAELIDKVKGIL